MTDLLLGQTLQFDADPFLEGPGAAHPSSRGGVLVRDGRIAALGDGAALRAAHPGARVHDDGDALISVGFVDAHVHYPQTGIIASWGKRLIDWLTPYTFSEEARFGDPAHAQAVAGTCLELMLANRMTTVCSCCAIHPESVDALFSAARARGMRVLAGKTCMDRNAPETLRNTAQAAPDQSKALLTRWHGVDRLSHVITPRFAPTSTLVIAQRAARADDLWQALFPTIMLGDDRAIRAIRTTWVGGRPRLGR